MKAEFADIENLKTQMLSKDEFVNEMKRLLKTKVCLCGKNSKNTFKFA